MSESRSLRLRDLGLAYLGKIIAVQSHEVTNAFNVINEMAGLQLDILEASGNQGAVDVLKMENICQKIRQHVKRGETTIRNINWLAHSVDSLLAIVDLQEMLLKITEVASYWTRLKRTDLVTEFPQTSAYVETRPFFLAFAVFISIEIATVAQKGEQTIAISYEGVKDGVEVGITNKLASPVQQVDETQISTLKELLDELEGELRTSPRGENETRVAFFLPHKQSSAEATPNPDNGE